MNLEELRSQHPELYSQAVQVGVDQERDRVCAHLTMGEKSGDTKTAFAAIRDGSMMTQTLMATYMAAGMNRSDRETRQAETDQAGAVVDNAPEGGDESLAAQVAARLEERLGKVG